MVEITLKNRADTMTGPRKPATGKIMSLAFIISALLISNSFAETWTATAYCACYRCCGKSDGITASGHKAAQGRTIACNWLKFGTKVKINGHAYIVEDRGCKSEFGTKNRHFKRLDIYFASHKEALKFGRKKVEVEIL